MLFTSESVSAGHPDKICDQISDALVDAYLKQDPYARLGIEACATTNRVVLMGEIRSTYEMPADEIESIIRRLVKDIGYEQDGFHHEHLVIHNYLHKQSADISLGVDETEDKPEGAGDQGIMFGYATRETEHYMPAPLHYSHRILETLFQKQKTTSLLGPDAKAQITLEYDEHHNPVRVHTVVLSTQHHPDYEMVQLKHDMKNLIQDVLPKAWVDDQTQFYINATGRFVIGGPDGDAGLTGRKIIVDTYGGAAPHGGGAFSGKDPTKVDRSAAYMARYLAKNIVAAGLCDRLVIQLSYCIGIAKPMSLALIPAGQLHCDRHQLTEYVLNTFDLTPKGIRTFLSLNRPIYLPTASFGHFGRQATTDGHFTWETLSHVQAFKSFL